MVKKALLLLSLFSAHSFAGYDAKGARIIDLVFSHWEIKYNCDAKGYEQFHYVTVPDTGNIKRLHPFHQEKSLPAECRQNKTSTYKRNKSAEDHYDRGHGVSQGIWDHRKSIMKESNSFSNVVPQHKSLNRYGLWRHTEKLEECFRDIDKGPVEVWGGVIWGRDATNDHFRESHGVITPDYLFKVILFPGDLGTYAWLMPNDATPTTKNMDDFLIAPAELAARLSSDEGIASEVTFPLGETTAQETTLRTPKGCDFS